MALNADKQGFLIGEPIDLETLLGELEGIKSKLGDIDDSIQNLDIGKLPNELIGAIRLDRQEDPKEEITTSDKTEDESELDSVATNKQQEISSNSYSSKAVNTDLLNVSTNTVNINNQPVTPNISSKNKAERSQGDFKTGSNKSESKTSSNSVIQVVLESSKPDNSKKVGLNEQNVENNKNIEKSSQQNQTAITHNQSNSVNAPKTAIATNNDSSSVVDTQNTNSAAITRNEGNLGTTNKIESKIDSIKGAVATNKGRQVDPGLNQLLVRENKDNKTAISTSRTDTKEIKRDEKGRFISKIGQDSSVKHDQSKTISTSITSGLKKVGDGVTDALGSLTQNNGEADPSIQAMNEVTGAVAPLGRGLGKVFGTSNNGLGKGQERWYRRFYRHFVDRGRVDDIANKREHLLLKNIERKRNPQSSSAGGFLATMLIAFVMFLAKTMVKGFQKIATPLRIFGALAKPLLKVLQALLKIVGLGKLASKIPIPDRNNKSRTSRNRTPNPIIGSSNKETNPNRSGKLGGLAGKAGKLAKRLPVIGALLTGGLLAKDLISTELSDLAPDEKTKRMSHVTGSGVGGIGGAVAGGLVGASIGSVVPIVGTTVGAVVGSILGGIGGDKIGGILGDKFGDWVNELRAQGVTDQIINRWQVGVLAMQLMWQDFTRYTGELWQQFSSTASATWQTVSLLASAAWGRIEAAWLASTDLASSVWGNVESGFNTASEFIQTQWLVTTTAVSGIMGTVAATLTSIGGDLNNAIKQYTGLDLGKKLSDLKSTVGGWVDSLSNTVSTVSSSLGESLKNIGGDLFGGIGGYLSNTWNTAENTINTSTSKERDNNQTAVYNSLTKAGFSKNQALALTAEIGRENGYDAKYLYGAHHDAANGLTNVGMISWQGDRAKKLYNYMDKKGLIKNGKMVRSQAALDAQAEFMRQEIMNDKTYAATKNAFEQNPNAAPEQYAKVLGKNYVRWAYGQNRLSNGKAFDWQKHDSKRRGYLNRMQQKLEITVPYRIGSSPNERAGKDGKNGVVEKTQSKTTNAASVKETTNSKTAPAEVQIANGKIESAETKEVVKQNASTTANSPAISSGAPVFNSLEELTKQVTNYDGMDVLKKAVIQMITGGENTSSNSISATNTVSNTNVATTGNISASTKVAMPSAIANMPAASAPFIPMQMGISDEPQVSLPLAEKRSGNTTPDMSDVSRDVSDKRFAHIVSGGYSR